MTRHISALSYILAWAEDGGPARCTTDLIKSSFGGDDWWMVEFEAFCWEHGLQYTHEDPISIEWLTGYQSSPYILVWGFDHEQPQTPEETAGEATAAGLS
jgi:hypothetical protein